MRVLLLRCMAQSSGCVPEPHAFVGDERPRS
jgi:hypothetical protein